MCSLVIEVFLALMVIAFLIAGAAFMAIIAVSILFIGSIGRYLKSRNLRASEMRCRNCGSTNIKLSMVSDGVDYNATSDHVMGVHVYSGKSKVRHKRIAVCQSCGYSYDYIMPEEVAKEKRDARNGMIGFGLIFAVCLMAMALSSGQSDSTKSESETASKSGSVWAVEATPLEDFDYYIDQNEIYLKDYKGSDEAVYVPSSYNVDGTEMNVVSLDGTFALTRIHSAIISDGIRYLSDNMFNSCGVEFVYLPASLESFNGWNYFHDVKKIYYGGNEDSWNQLCTVDRSSIDVQQIIYDTQVSSLTE